MTKTSSQGDFPPAGPGIHGDDGDSSPPCPAQRPEKFQGGPRGPPEALENRPPESTSSGVPFAEPLLANSRNSSTDALRFPIRFNRAIGRPLNSLEPPRIPDPSPERSQWPTAPPPPPSTSGICHRRPGLPGNRDSGGNGEKFARFPTGRSSRGSQRGYPADPRRIAGAKFPRPSTNSRPGAGARADRRPSTNSRPGFPAAWPEGWGRQLHPTARAPAAAHGTRAMVPPL